MGGSVPGVGALLGFLSGIPRTPQIVNVNPTVVAAPGDESGPNRPAGEWQSTLSSSSVTQSGERESNLEQISDWVTKLLVGGSLTQLHNIPDQFRSWGSWVALGIWGRDGKAARQ